MVNTQSRAEDHEVVNTRIFAVPRERLFAAFGDGEQLAKWWGPAGFTNTIHALDFRPGGAFRLEMHSSDGKNYPNECEFVEVVEPERIVIDHLRPVHRFLLTVLFDEHPQGAKVTWRMHFELPLEPKLKQFILGANEQNLDRLGAVVAAKP